MIRFDVVCAAIGEQAELLAERIFEEVGDADAVLTTRCLPLLGALQQSTEQSLHQMEVSVAMHCVALRWPTDAVPCRSVPCSTGASRVA